MFNRVSALDLGHEKLEPYKLTRSNQFVVLNHFQQLHSAKKSSPFFVGDGGWEGVILLLYMSVEKCHSNQQVRG